MLLYPNNSSSLTNYLLFIRFYSRGDSGTFRVKSIIETRDVKTKNYLREGGSAKSKRQEQQNFFQYCITWNTPPKGTDCHLWESFLMIDTEINFPAPGLDESLFLAICKPSVIIIRKTIVCEMLKEL
jgi:hypothetical protein